MDALGKLDEGMKGTWNLSVLFLIVAYESTIFPHKVYFKIVNVAMFLDTISIYENQLYFCVLANIWKIKYF